MENKFKLLAFFIKDFEIQCCFWALWTKSRVKTADFRDAAERSSELFTNFVEYWQGKTGKQLTFVDHSFTVSAHSNKHFIWLDDEVSDLLEGEESLDLIWYGQLFKEIYFKLRGYTNA